MAGSRSLRRTQRSWYVYDWANSAFQTTVITVFLGPFLTGLAQAAAADAQGSSGHWGSRSGRSRCIPT